MKKLDTIDRELLRILQVDAETPLAALAEAVHLSSTPCWRRLQRLREDGVIIKQVALLDPKKINLGVTVFAQVRTNQHTQAWFEKFHSAVSEIPEVVEFYRMSGEVDYLLRLVVPSIEVYDTVYKRLIQSADLLDVSSSFAMKVIKLTAALPLDYAE